MNLYLFRTLNDVRQMTGKWLGEYNGERPFESRTTWRSKSTE
ncbi:hypothetical protein JGC36_02205 [Erwinia amylovora]|nr:hypothetical protein JGC36_02205 [Erwinia amylovora]